MPDHVLGDKHFQMHFAVVNHERVADELWNDRACPRPGCNGVFDALLVQLLDLAEQLRIDVRTFFE